MTRPIEWDAFKWVVSGLLSLIVSLLAALFLSLVTQVGRVDAKIDRAIASATQNNIELVRAVATLTGKVDALTEEMRRR